jgi:hypothetical protein
MVWYEHLFGVLAMIGVCWILVMAFIYAAFWLSGQISEQEERRRQGDIEVVQESQDPKIRTCDFDE